jgi:hypothetical protein
LGSLGEVGSGSAFPHKVIDVDRAAFLVSLSGYGVPQHLLCAADDGLRVQSLRDVPYSWGAAFNSATTAQRLLCASLRLLVPCERRALTIFPLTL